MTTFVAIGGFIGGFAFGLLIINLFLRTKSKSELVENKSLRWTYGLAVWICAALGSWAALWVYDQF